MATPKEADELIEELCELIDGIGSETKERAEESGFDMEDIRERAVDMGETVARLKRVSDRQIECLENWKRGVSGWVH